MRVCAAALLLITVAVGEASPNVPLDDPAYDELARLRALGKLPSYDGGFAPLTERRISELLHVAGEQATTEDADGWSIAVIERARLRLLAVSDDARPYSTVRRPRDLTGNVAVSCEHDQGEPCGQGVGLAFDLQSGVRYRNWLSAAVQLRAMAGTNEYDLSSDVERAYVTLEEEHVVLEVGRDTFELGPRARTRLAWSDHAPPLDHVRVSSARPLALTGWLHVDGQYVLGRLRAPQQYAGNLISIARPQLDVGSNVELGLVQLLQLAGDGAPSIGVLDFILEHVRRRDSTASMSDSSNRRFGGDLAVRLDGLRGLRLYYAVMFEDIRRARVIDAIRYDADHLVGAELAAIGPGRRHGVTMEWHQTGIRSHEHSPRVTGLTNAGRTVGSPLGPDAVSWFASARIAATATTISPWLEYARLSSDTYEFIIDGPINRVSNGIDEVRVRAGVDARVKLATELTLETNMFIENVRNYAFVANAHRVNAGVAVGLVWAPRTFARISWR
jgi:hypothetical protein